MARIRTIKPEFWADEKLAFMTPLERLVFLGLISMADDAGRLVDNVKTIDGLLFPETEDSSRDALEKLATFDRIVRYESESGQRLIQVTNWSRHQKVDKPAKYVLPGPPNGNGNGGRPRGSGKRADTSSGETREGVARPSRDSSEDHARSQRGSSESAARSSRSDLLPTTNDLGPTTNDLKSGATANSAADGGELRVLSGDREAAPLLLRSIAECSLAVIEFREVFYGHATNERKREVDAQLLRLANGKAVRKSKGVYVRALSSRRLESKCLEVIDQGIRDHDTAIAVLLIKLGDTSDITLAIVETDNRELQQDHLARARQLRDAEAWLALNPEMLTELTTRVGERMPHDRELKGFEKLGESLGSVWRSVVLLELYAQATSPTAAEGGAP